MTTLALIVLSLAAALFAGLWLRLRSRVTRLRADLESARQDAERATEARESFFDLVTHELRSPLSAIMGYQELLKDGAFGPIADEADEPIDRIGRSARHLLHLIDGVVELSRLRSGAIRFTTSRVDLGGVLPPIADSFRRQVADRGLEHHVRMPDRLPTFHSDPDRLTRALDLIVTSVVKNPAGHLIEMIVDASSDSVTITFRGTEIAARHPIDDPALHFGIRIAVAERIAGLLGGSLALERDDHGNVHGLTFRVSDMPPGPATSTL